MPGFDTQESSAYQASTLLTEPPLQPLLLIFYTLMEVLPNTPVIKITGERRGEVLSGVRSGACNSIRHPLILQAASSLDPVYSL